MNSAVKKTTLNETFDVEPVLRKVFIDAEKEHSLLQQMFAVMGWEDLPDRLKMEIKDDVSAMADELKGIYSTCDPYVIKRRERVAYWVECYRDGMCSLETAIDALKVTKL